LEEIISPGFTKAANVPDLVISNLLKKIKQMYGVLKLKMIHGL
jgi:hypothetical protein